MVVTTIVILNSLELLESICYEGTKVGWPLFTHMEGIPKQFYKKASDFFSCINLSSMTVRGEGGDLLLASF